MDQNFQTSFIPKKPIIKERAVASRPVGLFIILSLLVLVAVVLATGGLYFYKGVLTKQLDQKKEDLNLARNRFEPSAIAELQTLDKRLQASSEILAKHLTVTPIFNALEQLTMKTIRYTKFSFAAGEGNDSKIGVKLSGMAIGYRSVALQADLLAKNKNLIDPIFSNLTLDNSGNVLFDLQFSVDPSFINYKQVILTQTQS